MNLISCCFKQMKMENQIGIGVTLIFILTLLVLAIIYTIQNFYLSSIISSSGQILFLKQEQTSLNNLAYFTKKFIRKKSQIDAAQLKSINEFFNFFGEVQGSYQNSSHLEFCVFEQDIQQNWIRYSAAQFCYQSCAAEDQITLPQHNPIIEVFNQTTQLISQFTISLSVDINSIISYSDLFETQFFSAYPYAVSIQGFVPSQRLWYQNHLTQMKLHPNQDLFYSPIFKSLHLKKYAFSLTNTIYSAAQDKIGISSQQIIIDDNFVQEIPYNTLVLNKDGQIIFDAANFQIDSAEIVYFFNETVTGFNITDWENINFFINNSLSIGHYCNSSYNTNCLFDKQLGKDVIFTTTLLKDFNFIIFIYSNITLSEQINAQMQQMQNQLTNILWKFGLIQILSSLIVLIISILITHKIFLPLSELMDTINNHMSKLGNNLDRQIFKLFNQRIHKSKNVFSGLKQQLMKFTDVLNKGIKHKNPICAQIEKFQYNKQQVNQNFLIPIEKIQNREIELGQFQVLQFIKQLLPEQMKVANYIQ